MQNTESRQRAIEQRIIKARRQIKETYATTVPRMNNPRLSSEEAT